MCLLCGLFIFKCFNYIKVGEKNALDTMKICIGKPIMSN